MLSSMSLAVGRSLFRGVRRWPISPATTVWAAMSTRASHVHGRNDMLEKTLQLAMDRQRWHDHADTIQEVHDLLTEYKTNHAVPEPDGVFDERVFQELSSIQSMMKDANKDHDAVGHRCLQLKNMIKEKMYGYHIATTHGRS